LASRSAFETDLVAAVPRLRRFAYALTGSMEDGDELVQAACERALRNEAKFREGTRMDSWLFRIAQNLWRDSKRRERTRGSEIDPDDVGLSDEGISSRRPEDRMMLASVRDAVATLTRDQRLVLALVAVDGMSYRQAAEVMDVPVGTVMSRLSRARAQLSAMIEEPKSS
jgi:RNA polymerase sigma-70 factor, ECF subfamily